MNRRDEELRRRLRKLRRKQIQAILAVPWRQFPSARASLPLLSGALRLLPSKRTCTLDSPLLGGWIQDVLFWQEALQKADRLRADGGSSRDRILLFQQIARTEFLAEAVPAGRLDPAFPRRARQIARRILRARLKDLPRILWPHFPPRRKARVQFRFVENPDEGCPTGRVRLGMTRATLVWKGRGPALPVSGRIEGGDLVVPGRLKLELHDAIPGTSILLAQRLVSRSGSLRVGAKVPGLGHRLARALALVDHAWPAAGEEIRRRTWLLVPLLEPGTVSYSRLALPGISYINVSRGALLDLADDLLHETAHHRLHAWQELADFTRHTDSGPHYYSPWRRSPRPLNGILHGTYTFLFRAELFLRISAADLPLSPRRRRWLRQEAARELRHCGQSLDDLRQARREGWLTAAGRTLVRSMQRHLAKLRIGRLSDAGQFSIF